jgi:hypothetical protein
MAQRAILLGSCLHLVLSDEITIKTFARNCTSIIEFGKQILVLLKPLLCNLSLMSPTRNCEVHHIT